MSSLDRPEGSTLVFVSDELLVRLMKNPQRRGVNRRFHDHRQPAHAEMLRQ
jgi:hypothetical protein